MMKMVILLLASSLSSGLFAIEQDRETHQAGLDRACSDAQQLLIVQGRQQRIDTCIKEGAKRPAASRSLPASASARATSVLIFPRCLPASRPRPIARVTGNKPRREHDPTPRTDPAISGRAGRRQLRRQGPWRHGDEVDRSGRLRLRRRLVWRLCRHRLCGGIRFYAPSR